MMAAAGGADGELMWAYLLHLGYNMWGDKPGHAEYTGASRALRCDEVFWDELVAFLAECGVNTCVVDLGEGVAYRSRPELAVEGSWSPERLESKLGAMRAAGITPVPKLNFSACHDEWMGEYARCVSTKRYYDLCRDVVDEACELFGRPALFHIGMDEETYGHQKDYSCAVVRGEDLWWHDFYYLVDLVEKNGARAWAWSDYLWDHPDTFLRKMPRGVLQSNWYYGRFTPSELEGPEIKSYRILEDNGYDQVPAGSNWSCSENFGRTVGHCKNLISPGHLKGFLQSPWKPTLLDRKYRHFEAADLVAQAKRDFYGQENRPQPYGENLYAKR